MLIVLKKGRRDFHRLCIAQSANPQQALRDFADQVFNAMSERHHQDFFQIQAEEHRQRRHLEFFTYEQIGGSNHGPAGSYGGLLLTQAECVQ